ncbi:helix-turn-helix domain-containing protein [Rhodobacteraceae bacterium F11138]|nr:helix-turn-helix domain-containing protein [Rhodobacteraceae bacterium F11138]
MNFGRGTSRRRRAYSTTKPTTKIVLWHLCDRFNPDYGCFPAQDRLAHDCEISRATLNTHLGLLEQAGLLRRVRRVDPRTRRQLSTRYVLAFEEGFTPGPQGSPGSTDGSCDCANQIPCPDTGHGSNTDNPNGDNGLSDEFSAEPCPESGHGAVSRNQPEPCPENRQSRVQNLDTNLVREPLREPVKEEEGAQEREEVSEEFFGKLLGALGFAENDTLPAWWQGWPPRKHVRRWRDDLGLSEARIIEVAAASRRTHPAPPDGPKALDRAMERAARTVTAPASGTGKRRKRGTSPTSPPSAEEMARFYAGMVNGDGYLPPSAISTQVRELLLAHGLVTPERLRERGVL